MRRYYVSLMTAFTIYSKKLLTYIFIERATIFLVERDDGMSIAYLLEVQSLSNF